MYYILLCTYYIIPILNKIQEFSNIHFDVAQLIQTTSWKVFIFIGRQLKGFVLFYDTSHLYIFYRGSHLVNAIVINKTLLWNVSNHQNNLLNLQLIIFYCVLNSSNTVVYEFKFWFLNIYSTLPACRWGNIPNSLTQFVKYTGVSCTSSLLLLTFKFSKHYKFYNAKWHGINHLKNKLKHLHISLSKFNISGYNYGRKTVGIYYKYQ